MVFSKRLRDRVMLSEITCSVRIWRADRASNTHSSGQNVYLARFEYRE